MATGDSVVGEYRRRADECRAQAAKAKGENEKEKWLKLAAKWDDFARDAERTRKLFQTPAGGTLSHVRVLPLTYREPMAFETMPSRSIQHA
jgi:hypothetical protein